MAKDRERKPRLPSEVDKETIGQDHGYTPSSLTGQESDFNGEDIGPGWTPQDRTEAEQDDKK
ncbi:MAG: hypothetical protein ACYC3S_14105 [Chloroflexota bacterium]